MCRYSHEDNLQWNVHIVDHSWHMHACQICQVSDSMYCTLYAYTPCLKCSAQMLS